MARSHRPPPNGLPRRLAGFAAKYGADALTGSVLLLRIKRDIDNLMSAGLGLSTKFHAGPSPWSHCVLIAGPYREDLDIPILDCTIRDKDGNVDWKMPIEDLLSKPLDKQGDIYDGRVCDYVDRRVTQFGIKFMKDLTANDRQKIVASGRALKKKGYHYDIPGLLRVVDRLIFDPKNLPPPPKGLLHCSGFCQKAYFDALGINGMFYPKVQWAEDATDDEIWYPKRGTRYPPTVPLSHPPR
jgi:hypothetical protein